MGKPIVLRNANVIFVETGRVEQTNILIESGYISKIGFSDLEVDGEIIDLEGKWILPGLIDMHVHIKAGYAPLFTASGVTTVRNTAGSVVELQGMMNAKGAAKTPRVFAADRMIDGPPGLWGDSSPYNINIDDPEVARYEVRRQVKTGADFIKVYGWISKEVLEAVVDEATKFNKEVSCDLIHLREVNAIDAAQMGVRWNEHASGILQCIFSDWSMQADDEVWEKIDWDNPNVLEIERICQKLIEHNVAICPTMTLFNQQKRLENPWYPKNIVTEKMEENEGLIQQWESLLAYKSSLSKLGIQSTYNQSIAKVYHDLGGTVVTGTDTPAGTYTLPGMALHRELELFVEAGFTELEAIQASTVKAARALKEERLGVIKESAYADLLILNSNPLENIEQTKDIYKVMKGGVLYNQQEILDSVPSKEEVMAILERFMGEYVDETLLFIEEKTSKL